MRAQSAPTGSSGTTLIETVFGEFAVEPDSVVSFPCGLPGFERCRSFVVLSSEALAPLSCLQSVGDPSASFLVIDPRRVLPDYHCALSQADVARLGAGDAGALTWLAIVSFGDDDVAWANLRAPVVINPERMVGYQVLPHNSLYPLRHPLSAA